MKDLRVENYVNRLYNERYREFKAELNAYYKMCKTPENALANPPLEMLERGVEHWVELCKHLQSEKFMVFFVVVFFNLLKCFFS